MHISSLPNKPGLIHTWNNLYGCSRSLAIASFAIQQQNLTCIITTSSLEADKLEQEIRFFIPPETMPIMQLPSSETLAYELLSPHQHITSARIHCLYQLPHIKQGIFIISAANLLQRLPPQEFIQQHTLFLDVNQSITIEEFRSKLLSSNYANVQTVYAHGEFAIRGGIMDVFPMGSKYPYRIELHDNTVDSMRSFDPDTQKSIAKINKIKILPAKEFPTDKSALLNFKKQWVEIFKHTDNHLYQDVVKGILPAGVEYYMPLFCNETATIFDYLPQSSLLIAPSDWFQTLETAWQQVSRRYASAVDLRPVLEVKQLYLAVNETAQYIKNYPLIKINSAGGGTSSTNTKLHSQTFNIQPLPDISVKYKNKSPLTKLEQFIHAHPQMKIVFCANSAGQQEALKHLLQKIAVSPTAYNSWHAYINQSLPQKHSYAMVINSIDAGCILDDDNLALISELDILGNQIRQQKNLTGLDNQPWLVQNLDQLNLGDAIVHAHKGVGRYCGLVQLGTNNAVTECLIIEYADKDKVYVPVTSLHLISPYAGTDGEHIPLHSLSKKNWQTLKNKALEKLQDIAAKLLNSYAKRNIALTAPFTLSQDYQQFATGFPYVETQDQTTAINQVLEDLQSSKIMNRLICGDVGFGKTEVAMRSVFVTVDNHNQALVLVPTTLLAQQHYNNFIDRFVDWPINIALLSRFKTASEQKKIMQDWQTGTIDILIGTHKILNKNLHSKKLGLLIIDEEHRFGVAQKEKLTAKYHQVNTLLLTATPIPRTLNMSLSKLRDISIISTAPNSRIAVKTFIHTYSAEIVFEAVSREINRGGQVYFLHNEVSSIDKVTLKLQELFPEVRITLAHGQMHKSQLEQTMRDFYRQQYQVLVCTTIIESGLDIPSANTIIINRADKLGLAQLHQLRGRVGRSHHQAYAYLLIPNLELLKKDASKRLTALTSSDSLGAGFTLAMRDLEIRGAGELLGTEQSGQIQQIGFSLYMDMLNKTIDAMQKGKSLSIDDDIFATTTIDLGAPSLLPDRYIHDVHTRLLIYKRISACMDENKLHKILAELIDRFGELPVAGENLFSVTRLKISTAGLNFTAITATDKKIILSFNQHTKVSTAKLINLVQQQPQQYQLSQDKMTYNCDMPQIKNRIDMINQIIAKIS